MLPAYACLMGSERCPREQFALFRTAQKMVALGSSSTAAFRERVLNLKGWDAEYIVVGSFLAKQAATADAISAMKEAIEIECNKRYGFSPCL
jgi:hypothetical protein